MIEKIEKDNQLLAIIIRKELDDKLNFITPDESTMQIGIQNRKKGEEILPHKHKPIPELKNIPVHETFHIIQGKAQVSIFDSNKQLEKQVILNPGDTIFLSTGHSITFLEDTKMLEVKQGPYRGKETEKEYL